MKFQLDASGRFKTGQYAFLEKHTLRRRAISALRVRACLIFDEVRRRRLKSKLLDAHSIALRRVAAHSAKALHGA